jgi:hypothetical protein
VEGRDPDPYRSYLLRLWREERQGVQVWRASLQSVQTGERLAFASLEALCDFLKQETRTDQATAREGRDEGDRREVPMD